MKRNAIKLGAILITSLLSLQSSGAAEAAKFQKWQKPAPAAKNFRPVAPKRPVLRLPTATKQVFQGDVKDRKLHPPLTPKQGRL